MVETDAPGGVEVGDDGSNDFAKVLRYACEHAIQWRASIAERPIYPTAGPEELRDVLACGGLPQAAGDPIDTLDHLVRTGELGSTASAGPRYFGYVIGSSFPVALAADWLVSTWDQNATLHSCGPAVSVIESVCAEWLIDLLGLPEGTSVGFTTGTQMAAFTGLAAARHHLLAARGWDVQREGLWGAPRIPVLGSAERHASIDRALRYLGMGTRVHSIGCDAQGAIDLARFDEALDSVLSATEVPPIVCVQAGSINTGAVDPLAEICARVHAHGGWVHVDGAIGLWALASDRHRDILDGAERADSWTTDAHKWLNVPFDCGIAFVAHPQAHRAAVHVTADYLEASEHRDQINTVPEWSRRARSVPVYATLRTLGRSGVSRLIDTNIERARQMAVLLSVESGIEVLNEVVLNQVLVRFTAPNRDPDALTRDVIRRVQEDGTCWLSGSAYNGNTVMRISICSWLTSAADIARSAEAIVGCYRAAANRTV